MLSIVYLYNSYDLSLCTISAKGVLQVPHFHWIALHGLTVADDVKGRNYQEDEHDIFSLFFPTG